MLLVEAARLGYHIHLNASQNKQKMKHGAAIQSDASVTENLLAIKRAAKVKATDLALKTGLNRMTIAAAQGTADPRLSTVVALLDAMGYGLLPVPQHLLEATANFINNEGQVLSLPAGVNAPLGVAQRFMQQAAQSAQAAPKAKPHAAED